MPTVPLQMNNRIWLTYRHFPYKPWHAVAELVDNSTQSYFGSRALLDEALEREGSWLQVKIDFDRDTLFSVTDNALGMDLDDLARAIQLGTPPADTSGRSEFGMGMKTSCCWLGDRWQVITKKLGSEEEYTLTVDVPRLAEADAHDLPVTAKHVADPSQHYTRVEVTKLHRRLHGRTLGRSKTYLKEMFRDDIVNNIMDLRWDGEKLEPDAVEPLLTDENGVTREWKRDVDFDVEGLRVYGWICILRKGSRARAGFDLYRRGRVIRGRPLGYRPQTIFGEARNDLINQRLYGQLHLDGFPVNHLKDDFLWDGREDEFQERLRAVAEDYIDFARSYRTRESGQHVATPVVHATNDEIAQELTEKQMLERLTIAQVGAVDADADEAVLEAKAEMLRAQKLEARIVEVGPYTFRIYHPEGMSPAEPYFFRQSAQVGEIDIFLNDNHPYVLEVTDESDYLMFARMCVVDAIVEHFMLHQGGDVAPTFSAKLKDQILRGFNV